MREIYSVEQELRFYFLQSVCHGKNVNVSFVKKKPYHWYRVKNSIENSAYILYDRFIAGQKENMGKLCFT
jgi:hypothetical protein